MKVKPTTQMLGSLRRWLSSQSIPRHVVQEFTGQGDFVYTRRGLIFMDPDSGVAAIWIGNCWRKATWEEIRPICDRPPQR